MCREEEGSWQQPVKHAFRLFQQRAEDVGPRLFKPLVAAGYQDTVVPPESDRTGGVESDARDVQIAVTVDIHQPRPQVVLMAFVDLDRFEPGIA